MDCPIFIETVAEHKVDFNRLPANASILDLGCLGFTYTNEMRRLGYTVYPVDIQEFEGNYHRVAITDYDGYGYILYNDDRQATMFSQFPQKGIRTERLKCRTLKSFMKDIGVEMFSLIKIDVEGSEWQIITSLDFAPAYQIEIEFHLHTGAYFENDVNMMLSKLRSLGYMIASHEKTSQHGCGMNYWSSLFILK